MLDASEDGGTYVNIGEVRAPPDEEDEEVTGVDEPAPSARVEVETEPPDVVQEVISGPRIQEQNEP